MSTSNFSPTSQASTPSSRRQINLRQVVALTLAILLALQLIGVGAFTNSRAFAAEPSEIGLEVDGTTDPNTATATSPLQPAAVSKALSTNITTSSEQPLQLLEAQTVTGLPTAPSPYAWSRTAAQTTGDFFADTYNGVGSGSVFEDVTVDRLADILSAAGDYYIVFANPNSAAGQVILADINAQAKAAGITKIYHFNPIVDNWRLDITSTNPAIRDITSGSWTTDITGGAEGTSFATIPHSIGGIYTYIQSFLPVYYAANVTEQDLATRAIFDNYTSQQTLLFRFHKDNHTDLPAAARIDATYLFGQADGTVNYNQTAEVSKITAAFKNGTNTVASSVRSEYSFLKRAFTTTGANPAISDADFASGATYTGNTITFAELFNLLNSPGEHSFYFYAFGCSDTKPLIAKALKAARDNNVPLYLVDGSLGGSARFKSGADIDALSAQTSNAWLNIRLANNASETSAQKQLSYLYGELVNGYFGDGFITQNSFAKGSNNIQYYINGDIGNPDALTNGFKQDGATRPYAPRFQYPILVTYNKAYVQPVTLDTTAIQVTPRDSAGHVGSPVTAVTEYMNSVATADKTNFGGAAASFPNVYIPYANATNPAFLAVARADQELVTQTPNPFTTVGTPYITSDDKDGLPVIGVALHANTGTWSPVPSSFSYQWYSFETPIAGATEASYVPTIEDYCNEIWVKVTANLDGYEVTAAASDFVQPEPAIDDGDGEITGPAVLTFDGATEAVVGADVEYAIGIGNIVGLATVRVQIAASDKLELKSYEALSEGWAVNQLGTTGGTTEFLFYPLGNDPTLRITDATPQLKLVYTAKATGEATLTLALAVATKTSGKVESIEQVQLADVTLPAGDAATITTTVSPGSPVYARFDFNRDGVVDDLDLAFAKGYYRASAETGGPEWSVVADRGIDVNDDGEVTVADYIIIISNIFNL